MNAPPMTEWLNDLLLILQWLQQSALWVFHALTGKQTEFGQAAWPFSYRIAGEILIIDHGLARQLIISLVGVLLLLLLFVLACFWGRARGWLGLVAVLLVAFVPWPGKTILANAVPTSMHQSPTGFNAASIQLGSRVYARHCLNCHGADGRGHGIDAKKLSFLPPDLTSQLLGKRADGELVWHMLYGMQDGQGKQTMPGFAGELTPEDTWALLDYLKALAAGQGAARNGVWPIPVALPDFEVLCNYGDSGRMRSLQRNQFVRLVAVGGEEEIVEDPRFFTVLVGPAADTHENPYVQCRVKDDAVWQSLALIAGTTAKDFPGSQFLADGAGWLRARTFAAWSTDDFLCRDGDVPAKKEKMVDELQELLLRMDREPVRYIKGGFVH